MPTAAGWFRPEATSEEFFPCEVAEDCVGGTVDQQCALGHGGILCAVCDDGFIRQNDVCTACTNTDTTGTLGIVIAATGPPFLLFFALLMYFLRKTKEEDEEDEEDQNTTKVAPAKSKVSKVEEKKKDKKVAPDTSNSDKVRVVQQLTHTAHTFQHSSLNAGPSDTRSTVETAASEVVGEAVEEGLGGEDEIEAELGDKFEMAGLGDLSSLAVGATKGFRTLGHRLRILIGYAQITSALVFSFDIPWPPLTLGFLKSLTFINFNFMDFFAPIDPCLLHTPFLKQAVFHMAIPPLCAVVIVSASLVATLRNKAKDVWPKAKATLVTIIFLLYPGIVTRVFTTFKCKKIGDKRYLVADYSVVCGEGEHATMSIVMFMFAGVYVIGIPLGSMLILFWNKKLLAVGDDASRALRKKSEAFAKVFGALYDAYSPRYWWFEAVVMIQKAMLTGGLVLVAPGSSAQVLVGLVIASGFLIVLMQTKPYKEAGEEIMQTIATVSTCATLLIGFTLKVDRGASGEQAGEYDDAIIDIILIMLFTGVGISGLYMILRSLPCFESGEEEESAAGKDEKDAKDKKKSRALEVSQVRSWGRAE